MSRVLSSTERMRLEPPRGGIFHRQQRRRALRGRGWGGGAQAAWHVAGGDGQGAADVVGSRQLRWNLRTHVFTRRPHAWNRKSPQQLLNALVFRPPDPPNAPEDPPKLLAFAIFKIKVRFLKVSTIT